LLDLRDSHVAAVL